MHPVTGSPIVDLMMVEPKTLFAWKQEYGRNLSYQELTPIVKQLQELRSVDISSSKEICPGGLNDVTAGALLVIGELLSLIVGLSPGPEDLATTSSVFQSVLFLLGFVLSLGRTDSGRAG